MRVRIEDDWIAGHPEYDPAAWTPAQDITFTGLHEVTPQTGAGWVSRAFYDGGNRGVVVRFNVTRLFANVRDLGAHIKDLFSSSPPHPLTGVVYLRWDDDVGVLEDRLLDAVVSVQSVVPVGALTLRITYEIKGGLINHYAASEFCLLLTDEGFPLVQDDGDYIHLECAEIDPPYEPPYGYYWTP
jgi:hypothetical protein